MKTKSQLQEEFDTEEKQLRKIILQEEAELAGYKKDVKKIQETIHIFATRRGFRGESEVKSLLRKNEVTSRQNILEADKRISSKKDQLKAMKKEHARIIEDF